MQQEHAEACAGSALMRVFTIVAPKPVTQSGAYHMSSRCRHTELETKGGSRQAFQQV